MKGFKPTGNGPVYGDHKFTPQSGFTGSTGKVQTVRGFTRGVPKYAKGGTVGNAAVLRDKPVTQFDRDYGGKTPLQSKFAKGGSPKKFIQGAIKHPGSLRAALHAKPGQSIPAKKLEKAAHSENPTMRKRAVLAQTLKRMHKAEGGKVGTAMAALKSVRQLMDSGVDATRAAAQAAQKHSMDLKEIQDAMKSKGMQPNPGFLKRGGAAARGVASRGVGSFNRTPMIKC